MVSVSERESQEREKKRKWSNKVPKKERVVSLDDKIWSPGSHDFYIGKLLMYLGSEHWGLKLFI
jgi:hypothetical protein